MRCTLTCIGLLASPPMPNALVSRLRLLSTTGCLAGLALLRPNIDMVGERGAVTKAEEGVADGRAER